MSSPSDIRSTSARILERYGILIAGLLIFVYYLWSAIDLFEGPRRDLQGYLFQFDTLIVLWLLLVVLAKLHEYRKRQKEEAERNRRIAQEHERQKMRLDLLDEVSEQLTDAINNPLSIISLSAGSLRERFSSDADVTAFLDRIDGALRRLREVMVDFQQYQTRKIMKGPDPLAAPPAPASPRAVPDAPTTVLPGVS